MNSNPWKEKMGADGFFCKFCGVVLDPTKPVLAQHKPDCPWLETYQRWQDTSKNESNWTNATKQLLQEES